MKPYFILFTLLQVSFLLSGCGGGGGGGANATASTDENNRVPSISGTPGSTVIAGNNYSFTPVANDLDGDSLTFSISNLPGWAAFNSANGILSGTPGLPDVGIYSDIVISASDGIATSSLEPFSISVRSINQAPTISGIPNTSQDEGTAYSFSPSSFDADGDSLIFSVTNLPNWAVFDTDTGQISGIPDYESAGFYQNIIVSVSDGIATSSLPSFNITVSDINRPPSISGQGPTSAPTGILYGFTPTAQDADGDSLSFSISNLPDWATFDLNTGYLSGTPNLDEIGTYSNIVITVTDGVSSVSLNPFTITVMSAEIIEPVSIFVDPLIGSNYCDNYNAATRSCSEGDKEAYRSLSGAASVAAAGNIVEIRGGAYNEQLLPQNSGNESEAITYRNFNDETVVITGTSLSPAIVISDKSYLIIEGLEISNVNRWMYALNAHHNIIRDNTFTGAIDAGGSSKTGLFFQEATFNQITNNTIDDSTQDNISLIKSDNNLIVGNTITRAAHSLWAIKCGNRNVIRGNYFYNSIQKIGEVYDCDSVGFDHQFFIHDSTKYNVIENNVFAKTSTYYSPSGGNGIQYAGQNGIIRFNVFYDNNVGIGMAHYSPEGLFNKHNRIYHNTFFGNHCGGVATSSSTTEDYSDNFFINNIFRKNVECAGTKPYQLVYRNGIGGFVFTNNNFSAGPIPSEIIGAWQGAGNTLSWYESNYSGLFSNNTEQDPSFSDEANLNFGLKASSPLIDAGAFLTATNSAGSGMIITVQDASFFYDGFGIPGESGDSILLEGDTTPARIVSINYNSNAITVDRYLIWSNKQGLSLAYSGPRPDIGAYEH